ncbi:LPXTG-site transpeptidase (sortase) family protein [Granulicatella balaenopterae]|uniref:LPXTG-site transpeptidase (Sortase) family protein n=1 Tax=Granulicatella balaenopterae TaxID=137733 RepID=A0A1H9HQ16_9LACT|nr:class C sortase [Granulicatella balaenopterae]SEQ64322.1 LPXTG-site transpeptidase (sortase) family protein [Granulicatella balaenopterae]
MSRKKIIGYLLMMLGICLPLYLLTQLSMSFIQNKMAYEKYQSHKLTSEEIQTEQEKIDDYNNQLLGKEVSVVDPFATDEFQIDYQIMDNPDAIFAYINIPSLNILEPIYLGASDYHLGIGTAHIDGTSLPVGGMDQRSVIAGHRGYYENFMFWSLGDLQPGDKIYIERNNEELVYEVSDTEVIDPSEWQKLAPIEGRDMLTLLTCEPFLPPRYQRLLVNCDRVYPEETPLDTPSEELATKDDTHPVLHQQAKILRNVVWSITAFSWVLLLVVFKKFYQYVH